MVIAPVGILSNYDQYANYNYETPSPDVPGDVCHSLYCVADVKVEF